MILFNIHKTKDRCDSVPFLMKSKSSIFGFRFILLILILYLCISLLVGCTQSATPFQEGTYISDGTSTTIPGIKLILTEIDKETYNNANGLNVVKETINSRQVHYYSFELFIYVADLDDYSQLKIIGFEQQKGAPQTYYLECDTSQEDAYELEDNNITFHFDERPFILLDDYYYYLKLQAE